MIHLQANNDVIVASVQVMILDEQGKTMEKGEAITGKGDCWAYVPGAKGKVVVERGIWRGIAKHNLIERFLISLGIKSDHDVDQMQIILRWARLKDFYKQRKLNKQK